MSQMISSGSRAATSTTKSHPPGVGHPVDDVVGHELDAILDRLDHARVEGGRHDAAQAGVARVVHVDHGAEEVEHLLGHVDDGGGAPARLEDLGVPAGLRDVGVRGQRVVALALRDHVGSAPRGSQAPRRTASAAHAAASGRRPPARPRAGPRTHVAKGRCRRPPGRHVVPRSPPYPPPYTATMCDTLCAPGPGGMVFAKNSDRPPGEIQIAWPFGRRASAGCTLRTQYLSIGDTGAHATFLSCPDLAVGSRARGQRARRGHRERACRHDARCRVGQAGADRHGPRPPGSRARPQRGGGGRGHDRAPRGMRAGWHRRRRPPGGLRLLVPHRRPVRCLRARDGRRPTTPSPRSPPAWPSPTGSRSAPDGPGPRPASPRATTSVASATTEDTAHADVRLAASRRFLASAPPGGLTPAATAAHLRDHGTGPWGAPGAEGPGDFRRPTASGEDRRGVSICMHVRGRQRHRGVHDRRAAGRPRRRGAPARLRGGGQPLRQHLRAGLPAHGRRPAARSSPSSSRARSCGTPPTRCASCVEADPAALAELRARPSRPSRTSCGPRPTTSPSTRPAGPTSARRGAAGPSTRCGPASPNQRRTGGTLRRHASVHSYSPRGM